MKIKNFEEVASALASNLESYLQEHNIDTSNLFRCISPTHDDKTPSCGVAPSKEAFHCFGCGISGGIFHAAHFLEGKPLTGHEFVSDTLVPLAEKYKVPVEIKPLTEEEIYELDTYKAYSSAAALAKGGQQTTLYKKELKKRKWKPDLCEEYGVGSIPSYKDFREQLKGLGYSAGFIDDVDLGRNEIFGEDKMVFTIRDEKGRPVGFASRNLSFTDDKTHGAKYVNQRHTGVKCNIYRKSQRLFGFDRALQHRDKRTKTIYVFEGYSDVLTAAQNGIWNAVAIGGTALTVEQVQLLKEYNFYDITLCLDGDRAGQDRTASLLDTILSGHKDLQVRILVIPGEKDPDDYIRAEGVEKFKKLKRWSAFEWRLAQFDDEEEGDSVCKSMIPLIINEANYVEQESMCKVLSKHTGITLKTIQAELGRLQNVREAEKARDRGNIIDKMTTQLRKQPDQAELYMAEAQGSLFDMARRYDEDSFSEDSVLSLLEGEKRAQEAKDGSFSGFILGPDLKSLQDSLCGDWKKDVWMCIGGKANSGKTSLVCKIGYEIARHEENNALVIYHSIDDTAEQVLPKFICLAEGSRKLSLNEVMDPNYHVNNGEDEILRDRRDTGYSVIRELIRKGRLIIKDANSGNSIGYAKRLIKYYREKYPGRNIVYILDNFHKLKDFSAMNTDERVRFKNVSELMKGVATENHICVMATVEYRKIMKGQKAGNDDISETVQIEYDANFVGHLWNEMHEKGEAAEHYHTRMVGTELIREPQVELNIGKNKITAFKNKLWFNFYPSCSDFVYVDEKIMEEKEAQVEEGKFDGTKPIFG